jgi:hypothetical protein
MKELKKYRSLFKVVLPLLFLFALVPGPLAAQDGSLQLPGKLNENIVLNCDRSIYGVSEKISYSAIYRGPGKSDGPAWSKVLYVELIQGDGSKQATSKVIIENNRAEGEISVPKNIPSGVYYLRAYTKWMRNYGPTTYAYISLRILNPYSKEILAPGSSFDSLKLREHAPCKILEGVDFLGLKDQYDCHERVEFEIRIPENLLPGSYSLGIAKTESLSSLDYGFKEKIETGEESGKLSFLPEIEGLSLSGRIVDSETGLPVINERLQLSSYEDPFFFAELSSQKDGSFLFSMPHFRAKPEFHLAEAADSVQGHLIQLDPEFCNRPVLLPFEPFRIDTSEKEIVRELLVNLQLNDRFLEKLDSEKPEAKVSAAFYGSATAVIKVSDYIELSDLRECIDEIIPQVSIRSNNRGEYLTIIGLSCLDIYPPLVLIDNVPVPNNDVLLHIPSSRIKSIEVLNEAYMIGEFRYSGIINIFSNQHDMAGISLDGEHSFFDFQLLDNKLDIPEFQKDSDSSDLPDVRNQLYWEPEIEFTDKADFRIVFFTSDASGLYLVTLRRADQKNGTSTYKKALFRVK